MVWTVGLRGLQVPFGCFHTYVLFPINTPEGAQAATAHRDVKTKCGLWQPRLCGVQGSVFPHFTHLWQRLLMILLIVVIILVNILSK